MSAFNPEDFMATQIKGEIDTKIIPIPEDDYTGQIQKLTTRVNTDGTVIMDIHWEILDDSVKELTGMNVPIARQGIWLDLDESGNIDLSKGKNRQLGLVRTAVGQNSDKAWSPNMLLGMMALVKVEHSPNASDPESPYANVKRVAPSKK